MSEQPMVGISGDVPARHWERLEELKARDPFGAEDYRVHAEHGKSICLVCRICRYEREEERLTTVSLYQRFGAVHMVEKLGRGWSAHGCPSLFEAKREAIAWVEQHVAMIQEALS